MLEMNVQYRIAIKTSSYLIDLLLVFRKKLIVCSDSNSAFNNVYEESIDCLKNGVSDSHKNA